MRVSRCMITRMALITVVFLAAGTLFTACSSVKTPKSGEVSERYAFAQALIAEEDYDKAVFELESLMFDTRATALEDDVLFSLAEAYYNSKQYLLAVDIYKRLLEQTPGSPFAEDAQFKLAQSHEKLSPVSTRDHEHTRKAIREYQLYLELYPVRDAQQLKSDIDLYTELSRLNPENDSYKRSLAAAEAQYARIDNVTESISSITRLREKLAEHEFSIAEHYRKLKKYKGALSYYDGIIRFYPDTSYVEKAWYGKIDVLVKREKWFEAQAAIEAYDQQFPENMGKVDDFREKVIGHFENS